MNPRAASLGVFAALLVLLGEACHNDSNPGITQGDLTSALDEDGDGYASMVDCDDGDDSVNPGADEYCNGVDDDCDDEVDEDDAVDAPTWYPDADEDGYGSAEDGVESITSCEQPSGYVDNSQDCDDDDPALSVMYTYYEDADGDGYGNADVSVEGCSPPVGYVLDDTDCDDTDPEAYPGATWYLDEDGDGYGVEDDAEESCMPLEDRASQYGDCDDEDPDIHPDADEYCDGIDNDCDDEVDEYGAVDADTWYRDQDEDGYGDSDNSVAACSQPTGYVADDTDCDDLSADVNIDAQESCFDSIDNNCDGDVDEDCPVELCGDVTSDTTWSNSYDYYVSCTIYVEGSSSPQLEIEYGTHVYFAPGTALVIGESDPGSLLVEGSSDPVVFESGIPFTSSTDAASAGDWVGLRFGPYTDADASDVGNLQLSHGGYDDGSGDPVGCVVIEDNDIWISETEITECSGYGVQVLDGASPELSGCDISGVVEAEGDDGIGVYVDDDSSLSDFSSNTVTGNDAHPLEMRIDAVDVVDDSNDLTGNGSDYLVIRGTDLTSDLNMVAQSVPYRLTSDVEVYGGSDPVLEIDDEVEIYFDTGVELAIGGLTSAGGLAVNGGGTGVIFDAYDASSCWDGIYVGSGASSVELDGLSLWNAGGSSSTSAALYVSDGASLTLEDSAVEYSCSTGLYLEQSTTSWIQGSSFSYNEDYGIYMNDEAILSDSGSPTFSGNTLTGNGSYPMTVPASSLGQLDDLSSNTFSGNDQDWVVVWTANVTSDATWRAQDVPYLVEALGSVGDIEIDGTSGPVVTIEAGATFDMASAIGIVVGDTHEGGISTEGTSSDPVTFQSASGCSSPGEWAGISLGDQTISSDTVLEGIVVDCGGSNGQGNIYAYEGASPTLSDCTITNSSSNGLRMRKDYGLLYVYDCYIEDNADDGISLNTSSNLGGFSGNVISGNGGAPLTVNLEDLDYLDSGSTYSGNGEDTIEVQGDWVELDASWAALDVPYHFEDTFQIRNSATLTIEGGAELRFDASAGMNVGYRSTDKGSLVADGSTDPIIFTSSEASPAAGDWHGIQMKYCTSDVDLVGVEVNYAGGGSHAAIYFDNCDGSITDGTVQYSDDYGVDCGGNDVTLSGMIYTDNAEGDEQDCD